MLYDILQRILIKNKDETFKVEYDLLDEERIFYKIEKNFVWIYFSNKTCLIPLTTKGIDILWNTYYFICNLIMYEEMFEDVIYKRIDERVISQKQINDFYEIVDTYKKLEIYCLNKDDNILIFNTIKEYECTTKIQIYSLAKLEVLIRILNQNIREEDIKKLKDDEYTPIIFPIPKKYSFRKIEDNFYIGNIELSGLIHTGYLQLNNILLENKEGNRYGKTKKNW